MALFSIARPDTFATWQNWQSIFNLGSVVMVIAAALTVPMIMGDFDLSVGYNAQLLGAVAIVLVANVAISTGFTIVLTLLLGAAIGATIGAIVAWSKVSAFVITLGAGTVMLGIELRITHDGRNIFEGIPASYQSIATTSFLSLTLPVWITFGVYAVLWFVTEHTVVGRYMAAIGGNQEAARLSGIKVEIVRMLGFVIVGLGAALAGIILTSQAQSYYANAATGYLLPAYAGVFLGAATLRANQFHILGTFLGHDLGHQLVVVQRAAPLRDLAVDEHAQERLVPEQLVGGVRAVVDSGIEEIDVDGRRGHGVSSVAERACPESAPQTTARQTCVWSKFSTGCAKLAPENRARRRRCSSRTRSV